MRGRIDHDDNTENIWKLWLWKLHWFQDLTTTRNKFRHRWADFRNVLMSTHSIRLFFTLVASHVLVAQACSYVCRTSAVKFNVQTLNQQETWNVARTEAYQPAFNFNQTTWPGVKETEATSRKWDPHGRNSAKWWGRNTDHDVDGVSSNSSQKSKQRKKGWRISCVSHLSSLTPNFKNT